MQGDLGGSSEDRCGGEMGWQMPRTDGISSHALSLAVSGPSRDQKPRSPEAQWGKGPEGAQRPGLNLPSLAHCTHSHPSF